jgi:hypothetical protein
MIIIDTSYLPALNNCKIGRRYISNGDFRHWTTGFQDGDSLREGN